MVEPIISTMAQAKFTLIFLFIGYFTNAQEFITTWSKSSSTTTIEFEATTTGPVAYTWETLPPAASASGSGTFQGPDVVISGLPSTNDNISVLLKIQPMNFNSIKTNRWWIWTFFYYNRSKPMGKCGLGKYGKCF